MKIFILTKRQYTAKDLLDDHYGRLWHLPLELARKGHRVRGMCASYRARPQGWHEYEEKGVDLSWFSANIFEWVYPRLRAYSHQVSRHIEQFRPDVIWASSDIYHIILAAWLARRHGIPFVADLYDNYDSFASTRVFPGGKILFRNALRSAAAVSCASELLCSEFVEDALSGTPFAVIENGTDPKVFKSRDRGSSRKAVGLPDCGWIVGTAGALSHNRGIGVLFDAYIALVGRGVSVSLAVAGPRDRGLRLPDKGNVFDLGILPHPQVPFFLNALDVAVISNIDSTFGRYCFPAKFYEIQASETPVVAASVGAMRTLLAACPNCLYDPVDHLTLVDAILAQLRAPEYPKIPVPSWRVLAERLEILFQDALAEK